MVARKIYKLYSTSRQVFYSMFSVTIPTASSFLAFSSSQSASGEAQTLSLIYSHKSSGVMSGEWGGQSVGPFLPIYRFGNVSSKKSLTIKPKWSGVPYFWKTIHGLYSFSCGAMKNCKTCK